MLQGAFTAGKCYLTPGIGVVFEEQRKYFPGDLFKRYRAERLKILLDSHRWWQGLCCSVPRAHLPRCAMAPGLFKDALCCFTITQRSVQCPERWWSTVLALFFSQDNYLFKKETTLKWRQQLKEGGVWKDRGSSGLFCGGLWTHGRSEWLEEQHFTLGNWCCLAAKKGYYTLFIGS